MPLDGDLLYDIKLRCNITWDDPATDRKIEDIAAQGMQYINGKLGTEGDFSSPGFPRAMLMEYVRYVRDEALDVFEANYLSQLVAMRNERAVAEYAEETLSGD